MVTAVSGNSSQIIQKFCFIYYLLILNKYYTKFIFFLKKERLAHHKNKNCDANQSQVYGQCKCRKNPITNMPDFYSLFAMKRFPRNSTDYRVV